MRTSQKTYSMMVILMSIAYLSGLSQSFDLQKLLNDGELITQGKNTSALMENKKVAISCIGVVWIKSANFSNGTIEVDLRGKDVPQRSFLGIAFHGVDTTTYDAIYFRPFNFQSNDSVRKIHAVQYISEPDFPWQRLREEKNGVYEKGIFPAPSPTDWLHARIVVNNSTIKVYINNAASPSLTVDKLNNRKNGLIGLWSVGLNGEFANLVIKNN